MGLSLSSIQKGTGQGLGQTKEVAVPGIGLETGQDPGPATDKCPGKLPSAYDFLSRCWAHRSSQGNCQAPGPHSFGVFL